MGTENVVSGGCKINFSCYYWSISTNKKKTRVFLTIETYAIQIITANKQSGITCVIILVTRFKPAEVLVKDGKAVLIRKRDNMQDLLHNIVELL